jgi:hypothetical protein
MVVVKGFADAAMMEAISCREALALVADLQVTRLRIAINKQSR